MLDKINEMQVQNSQEKVDILKQFDIMTVVQREIVSDQKMFDVKFER